MKVLLFLGSLILLAVESAPQQLSPPPGVGQELEDCLAEFSLCTPYADSTTTRPPAVCCEPLERVIDNKGGSCLCLILGNHEVTQALDINVTKAVTLPQRCGLPPFDLSSNCQVSMPPSQAPSIMSTSNAPVPDCITELGLCLPFAHSTTTTPPTVCCEPLERVVENNVSCLCSIFTIDEVVQTLNLNITKAVTLPQCCGLQPFDISTNCPAPPKASATFLANAPTSVSQEPSQSPSSMSAANSPTPGGESSGTSNTARIGSAIFGSFFLCAIVIF